jgi:predicted Ser/Thr protein kinase
MAGVECFSQTEQGAQYIFSWLFPAEKILKGAHQIGFQDEAPSKHRLSSYAHMPLDRIDVRMTCDLHCHPLFLLPHTYRKEFFASLSLDDSCIGQYIRHGDLCLKCRRIYDALLQSYEGDYLAVLKHIRVERVWCSKRYHQHLVTVEPGVHIDAHVQQITMDRSLQQLPHALSHLALYGLHGPLAEANRGILEFNDLFKRPVESFKYLLGAVENGNVGLDSFVLWFDTVFIGSCNETYLEAFAQHPDFLSFQSRTKMIRVPYLRQIHKEKQVYKQMVHPKALTCHIAPHAFHIAATFAVLSRMMPPKLLPEYAEREGVLSKLQPLDKARMYDLGFFPGNSSFQEQKQWRAWLPDIYKEWHNEVHYEGRYGISARDMYGILHTAGHQKDFVCLHPLGVLSAIKEAIPQLSFALQSVSDLGHAYHPNQLLLACENYWLRIVHQEVCSSLGLADVEQYQKILTRYIQHISHWIKGERFLDPLLNEYVEPDLSFMKEIEAILLQEGDSVDNFRKELIGSIGARALESPEENLNYIEMFPQYVEYLKEDFFVKRSKTIEKHLRNYLAYSEEEHPPLDAKEQETLKCMRQSLLNDFRYCPICAKDTVAHLLKKSYQTPP